MEVPLRGLIGIFQYKNKQGMVNHIRRPKLEACSSLIAKREALNGVFVYGAIQCYD
ncbi:uncharacterized protein LACBIDRAFT_308081 [Laccaria bicolor S238N-H82]|uniref:Predicted protein n=1 Tax=Laccaria bicolor (strain S238N-H82 / ATCC MYA-4686) TaxID=486041 RepID=B0DRL3_LACBS|nr:uncharacterized protein LACBIDRAFT_308081 [Laccaria bicolor S238N-H82]EDR02891.1 predicted protein [Laccaria bicolor S238N-H82]|eukprot:XP_001886601.1 predicted protein [Laccaria bicolor S238N-H82]